MEHWVETDGDAVGNQLAAIGLGGDKLAGRGQQRGLVASEIAQSNVSQPLRFGLVASSSHFDKDLSITTDHVLPADQPFDCEGICYLVN